MARLARSGRSRSSLVHGIEMLDFTGQVVGKKNERLWWCGKGIGV